MNLDHLIAILAYAVREQWIAEAEALALVARFNAGALDRSAFALPQSEALALPAGVPTSEQRFFHGLDRESGQDYFAIVAQQAANEPSIATWQAALKFLVLGHIAHQAATALGRPLTGEDWQQLRPIALKQMVYLSRFAEQRMVLALIGKPMSQPQVAQRSALYSGSGRAVSFQFGEQLLGDGYVIDYQARDDSRTCDPCIGAEQGGPYLPTTGPMPGDVCLGAGFCRCLRVSRYAPAEAARLRGALQ